MALARSALVYSPPVSNDVSTELDERSDDAALAAAFALTVLVSPDPALAGRVIPLPARLAIGRTGGDLVIDDPKLSRAHAMLVRQPDGSYRVEDEKSANGTFVDGKRVRGHELPAGSILRVGQTIFEVGPGDAPPTDFRSDPDLIGHSRPLRRLLDAIDRVAQRDIGVLISGETGTGKELVARRLHARSRRKGQLVAVNCAAVPAQLFESALFGHRKGAFTDATADSVGYFGAAEGSTLFLDEVATLPLELQPKLLRAIETREVTPVGTTTAHRCDVRVVAASNVDLLRETADGRFRSDLYARLAEHRIDTPPLRRRRSDIPLLVRHFLAALAPGRSFAVSTGFLEELLIRDYPMNVRELRAAVQHAVLEAGDEGRLEVSMLPPAPPPPTAAPVDGSPQQPSRDELEAILARHGGNLTLVAKHYGRARMQIYRWLEKYELNPSDYRT